MAELRNPERRCSEPSMPQPPPCWSPSDCYYSKHCNTISCLQITLMTSAGQCQACGRDNANVPTVRRVRTRLRAQRTRWTPGGSGGGGELLAFVALALLNLTSLKPIESAPTSELGDSMIKVTRFQVPTQVRAGELRKLTCLYELHGATLHAMKLFKDDKEFYRYTPSDSKLTFPVVGVHVDQNRSNDREVWLKINKRSTGQYRCQVSIEGTFNSVSAERRMEVIEGTSGSASASSAMGGGGGNGHLAGASVWQQHLISQHQSRDSLTNRQQANTRLRMGSQSAVQQQQPSQLYGISPSLGYERGGGGGGGSSSATANHLNQANAASLALLGIASLLLQMLTITRNTIERAPP